MGYNWAGLGNALGTGVQQGTSAILDNHLKQRQALQGYQQQIDFIKNLPKADQDLFFRLQGGKSDPLTAIIAAMLGQSLGGVAATQQASPDAPDYTQPQYQGGEIKVRQKSDGQIGMIPFNEFDPKLYERVQ